jgi:transcription elongation factor Elf1
MRDWERDLAREVECPACGELAALPLGRLGDRLHFRCRLCGVNSSVPAEPVQADEAATPEELEHYETHCANCGREADRALLDSRRGACSDECEHALWALEVYGELPTKEA